MGGKGNNKQFNFFKNKKKYNINKNSYNQFNLIDFHYFFIFKNKLNSDRIYLNKIYSSVKKNLILFSSNILKVKLNYNLTYNTNTNTWNINKIVEANILQKISKYLKKKYFFLLKNKNFNFCTLNNKLKNINIKPKIKKNIITPNVIQNIKKRRNLRNNTNNLEKKNIKNATYLKTLIPNNIKLKVLKIKKVNPLCSINLDEQLEKQLDKKQLDKKLDKKQLDKNLDKDFNDNKLKSIRDIILPIKILDNNHLTKSINNLKKYFSNDSKFKKKNSKINIKKKIIEDYSSKISKTNNTIKIKNIKFCYINNKNNNYGILGLQIYYKINNKLVIGDIHGKLVDTPGNIIKSFDFENNDKIIEISLIYNNNKMWVSLNLKTLYENIYELRDLNSNNLTYKVFSMNDNEFIIGLTSTLNNNDQIIDWDFKKIII